jgi:FixJ family two-component response regulator
MPGTDGATLLARIATLHVVTARIVLSGHADDDLAQRAAAAAELVQLRPGRQRSDSQSSRNR